MHSVIDIMYHDIEMIEVPFVQCSDNVVAALYSTVESTVKM